MKNLLIPVLAFVFIVSGCKTETQKAEYAAPDISQVQLGEAKKSEKRKERALEGIVETRVGNFEFINGYPSDESIPQALQ